KQQVARFRALVFIDIDDEILWLSRSSPDDPNTQASLASARGNKAAQDGNDDQAVDHFKRSIDLYGKMPESTSSLNNASLAYFSLYRITLDRGDFTRASDKLDRAIALQPSNSILLTNGAASVIEGAVRDVIGDAVDLRALKRGGWDVFPYLYRTPA